MTVKFGYEDQIVAAGYSNGSVKIYNVNTSKLVKQLKTGETPKENGPINSLKWRPSSPNSQNIGSILLVANTNGTLCQYAAKSGKELFRTHEQDNYIMTVDYAPYGYHFATGGKDNVIRIYD